MRLFEIADSRICVLLDSKALGNGFIPWKTSFDSSSKKNLNSFWSGRLGLSLA